jgi:hypothetical protein
METIISNQFELIEKAEGYLITLNLAKQVEKYKTALILLQEMLITCGYKNADFSIFTWVDIHKHLMKMYPNINSFEF